MAKRAASSASALETSFSGDERFVVFHGKEAFLQGELMVRLRQALEARTGTDVETMRFDGERAQLADVLDELRSFGLMQQHKLVVVTDADPFVKAHREALSRYAQKPVETATLLLRCEQWHKGNLDKLIDKAPGVIVKCDEPSRGEVEAWLAARAVERYKVKIPREAMALLLDHIGVEIGRLDAEVGKLAAGVEPGGSIEAEQVRALVGFASDDEAWAIQEALLTGDPRRALEKLHELVDLSRKDEVPIGWFISDLMRKLHNAAAMAAEGESEFNICKQLKVWPPERQRPFMEAARKLGTGGAAKLLAAAIETDRRGKSGYGEPLTNLERLSVRVAGAIR